MTAAEWGELLEILIFWVMIYSILRALRSSRGLGVLKGVVAIWIGLYLISRLLEAQLGISLTRFDFLFEALLPVALTAIIVIFQPEVRRVLTRLGEKPFGWLAAPGSTRSVSPIVEIAGRLSRRRIGMLVVLERKVGISGIIETGVPMSAEVSAPLLESIFYPNSPLHDGAVVVRGDRIVSACCLLPLSDRPDLGPEIGTRHRAAIGLSEDTDAVVVVVSEQTGRISVAFRGHLRSMRDTRELEQFLSEVLAGREPPPPAGHSADRSASGVLATGSSQERTRSGTRGATPEPGGRSETRLLDADRTRITTPPARAAGARTEPAPGRPPAAEKGGSAAKSAAQGEDATARQGKEGAS